MRERKWKDFFEGLCSKLEIFSVCHLFVLQSCSVFVIPSYVSYT